jgi:hypothetical protein
MVARLGIHVIGPRYGESIAVELPDGGIGVIDSFADRKGSHPLVGFLATRFPALKQLRFFALTHPHADHCHRAAEIIDCYSPEELWVFRPFPLGHVQEYYKALAVHKAKDAVEAALELPAGSVALSLMQLDKRVDTLCNKGKLPYRALANGQSFPIANGTVQTHFLTPGLQLQLKYAYQLKSGAEAIFSDGPSLVAADKLPHPEHNLASGGMLFEYGETRILLMADAEDLLWHEWLASGPPAALRQPVHFLKASHHGSVNGYHNPLFAAVADPRVTIAVITPFNAGRVHLPVAAGVQAISPHVRDLYCTNRTEAMASTGLLWTAVTPTTIPRIPARWVVMIRRAPAIGRLLVPEAGMLVPAGADPLLPREWIADAHKEPALWQLVRPEFRRPTASPHVVDSHMVSAYYDDRGTLLELRIGEGGGRLDT